MSYHSLPIEVKRELQRRLTDRQLLAYGLRLNGSSWEQIAEWMSCSQRTARTHAARAAAVHKQITDEHTEEAA